MHNCIETYTMNTDLCKQIVEWTLNNRKRLEHDRLRQYSWIPLPQVDDNLHQQYMTELDSCLDQYKLKYPTCWKNLNLFDATEPRLQLYEPGDAYTHAHCENDGVPWTVRRHLVYMTYLNTVDEGGGTEFSDWDLTTDCVQGNTVIWPAGWQYYHRGIAAPSQRKMILTGWYVFRETTTAKPI